MENRLVKFIQDYYKTQGNVALHEPCLGELEKEYLAKTIDSTFISSVGEFVDTFSQELQEYTRTNKAIPLINGTSALHTALYLNNVAQGDLVITQAFTFVATCNAIAYLGAQPVLLDISPDTLSLCPIALANYLESNAILNDDGQCVERKSGKKISACIAVHSFGHSPLLDEINSICRDWHIPLIEDAAQALGSQYKGRGVGENSTCATLSFNGNKIISTGAGGAILSANEDFANTCAHVTSTSRLRSDMSDGEIDHDQLGFNYRMANINAALGCAQMKRLPEILKSKRLLAKHYQEFFKGTDYSMFSEPEHCESNYWLNALICPDKKSRDNLLNYLHKNHIGARPAWKPMNMLKMYAGCEEHTLKYTNDYYQRIVCLPSSARLTTQ